MRCLCGVVLACSTLTWAAEPLVPLRVMGQTVQIANSGLQPGPLVCPQKPTNSPPRSPAPPAEPTDIPDEDTVREALQALLPLPTAQPLRPNTALQSGPRGWRVAIWGDSHMAAAFFSDQMVRRMLPADARVESRFVHAGVGHGGVRGLVRKACVSGDWGRESAYAHADAAAAPGPGMTTLVAKRAGATLALDLRDAQGQPRHRQIQLLYHGEGGSPSRIALRLDDDGETELSLDKRPGPHALTLQLAQPLSTLQLRVLDGPLRLQGLQLPMSAQAAMQLDILAYPGATVAGWGRSDLGYLAAWYAEQNYDLALIAFGTNEGNDTRFNEASYRELLTRSLQNFKRVFPQIPCVLIGPGDRGVRVPKPKPQALPPKPGRHTAQPPSQAAALSRAGAKAANRKAASTAGSTSSPSKGPHRPASQAKSADKRPAKQPARAAQTGRAGAGKPHAGFAPAAPVPAPALPAAGDPASTTPNTAPDRATGASSASTANLLKYARVHAQINQIQAEVAAQQGCLAWTMQSAMGGPGSAYRWARQSPALMAPDLLHFTAAGYRELANAFLVDFGLVAP